MRLKNFAMSMLAAAVLAACGGTSPTPGDQTPKNKYASLVSFGDSLSDVGTYRVGTVRALGGGQFNINGTGQGELTGKNWIELLAAQAGVAAPCAAQTGLDGNAAQGFAVPVVNNASCTAYAQGGARVSHPVGSNHKLTGSPIGALTVPVATQIQNHLAKAGSFKADDLVTVLAGGNDALAALAGLSTAANTAGRTAYAAALTTALAAGAPNPATAAQAIGLAIQTEAARAGSTDQSVTQAAITAAVMAGNTSVASQAVYGPLVVGAQTAGNAAGQAYFANNAAGLVAGMTATGTELANLVKTQILAKGAQRVVVVNLPDLASTPYALEQSAEVRGLIDNMVKAFNAALSAGVSGETRALLVDAYTVNRDQIVNPAPYGLSNVKDRACDMNPQKNPLGSSLTCNQTNLVAGSVGTYLFADDVHPTPFGYKLLARYVSKAMVERGWL